MFPLCTGERNWPYLQGSAEAQCAGLTGGRHTGLVCFYFFPPFFRSWRLRERVGERGREEGRRSGCRFRGPGAHLWGPVSFLWNEITQPFTLSPWAVTPGGGCSGFFSLEPRFTLMCGELLIARKQTNSEAETHMNPPNERVWTEDTLSHTYPLLFEDISGEFAQESLHTTDRNTTPFNPFTPLSDALYPNKSPVTDAKKKNAHTFLKIKERQEREKKRIKYQPWKCWLRPKIKRQKCGSSLHADPVQSAGLSSDALTRNPEPHGLNGYGRTQDGCGSPVRHRWAL